MSVKALASQVPANLKKTCDASKNDNETMRQLTEKMHKLKFRLLDVQNKNQMLRKELTIANKVLRQEMPHGSVRGHEEEAFCLRNKISELQRQIEEIEGSSDQPKDGKIACRQDAKNKEKSTNPPKKQIYTEKLLGGCVDVKAKVDYWRNRNLELEKLTEQMRLELDRMLQKSEQNRGIQREYGGLERELRARQSERLDMQCKLDAVKTKNCQLSEELDMLRDDAERIRSKTNDDAMLLEALTSQQGNFQDLIERQRMMGESDHQRFRDDLREVQVKYTTSSNILEQLEETTREGNEAIQEIQDYRDLVTYAKEGIEDIIDPKLPDMAAENVEAPKNQDPNEADPLPPPDPELWDECERYLRDFESAQEEVEQLTEIAINNNRKLTDWRVQLRLAKEAFAQKNAELRDLQESIRTLESLKSSKPSRLVAEKQGAPSIMDELLIKLSIEKEMHRFLDSYWRIVEASTDGMFQIYSTGVDKMTKNFIDILKERKQSFGAKQGAEGATESNASSRAETDQKSSSKTSASIL